ncbi:MAG: hypothetical protein BWX71_02384 [Deltaproteobacteria bacterium ADurb.Bin072]|nr:MAG: hypothetical protein BWX71_02384 [Deltaproteobacteria bacterium ADurb.Bin072]
MSAERYFRLSPMTATCSTYFDAFRLFSMFWGEIFLPPEVTMRSLMRPVILRYPSLSISPMSPVRKNPSSVKASLVASGFL